MQPLLSLFPSCLSTEVFQPVKLSVLVTVNVMGQFSWATVPIFGQTTVYVAQSVCVSVRHN